MRRTHPNGSVEIDGLVKVRLVHARHGSILLPDLVMVADTAPSVSYTHLTLPTIYSV